MDYETREMLQMILQGMEKMENGLRSEISDVRSEISDVRSEISDVRSEISDVRAEVMASETRLNTRIDITETRIMVKIENDITKRLDALVDGYKGNYERQEELAQKVDSLDRRVDRLETIAV